MKIWVLLSIIIFGLCILFAPRLPFTDYPDWIYQGNILHGIISSDPLFIGAFRIVSPFVPNSVVTIVIGLLSFIITPDMAGRILVFVSALIMYLGLKGIYGNKNQLISEALAIIFTPAVFLFMGFISFYLGLGLFLVLVSWLRPSTKHLVTILKYSFSLILLYYIHFMVFFLACFWFLMKSLFFKDENTPGLKDLLPGYSATGLLTFLYLISISSAPSGDTILSYHPLSKIISFFTSLSIFYEFNDSSNFPALLVIIALNLIWVISFLYLLLYSAKGRISEIARNSKFVFGAVCFLLGLAMPLLVNGFGYNSEMRFYWIGVMFTTGAIFADPIKMPGKVKNLLVLVAILTITAKSAQIVFKGIDDSKFEAEISAIIPINESFQPVMISYEFPEYYPYRPGIQKRIATLCQHISDINRVPIYVYLNRHEIYRDIFMTGMIRSRYAPCDVRAFIEDTNASWGDECSKLLFICSSGFTEPFIKILAERFNIIKESPKFILASPKMTQQTKTKAAEGMVR